MLEGGQSVYRKRRRAGRWQCGQETQQPERPLDEDADLSPGTEGFSGAGPTSWCTLSPAPVLIHELSPGECEAVLQRATIGRVACAKDGQPYIVPVHVAFHERYLYGVATLGQKIEWMRTNSRVCVEVEEITDPRHWTTVLVFGHYEELPSTSIDREGRARAEELLADRSVFWLPATAKVPSHEHATPVLYRISIIRVTGRRMSRE